jgi:hypothetical protein
MKIDRVSYQKVYAVAAYVTERIGAEAGVAEWENPKDVLAELKKLCDEVNQANNPYLNHPTAQWSVPEGLPPEPEVLPATPVEKVTLVALSLVEQIQSCKSLTVLKIYKNLLKSESDKTAYEMKEYELKKREAEKQSLIDAADALLPEPHKIPKQKKIIN